MVKQVILKFTFNKQEGYDYKYEINSISYLKYNQIIIN